MSLGIVHTTCFDLVWFCFPVAHGYDSFDFMATKLSFGINRVKSMCCWAGIRDASRSIFQRACCKIFEQEELSRGRLDTRNFWVQSVEATCVNVSTLSQATC